MYFIKLTNIRINLILISKNDDEQKRHIISVDENNNLLDAINEASLPDISVFGVCNKQLACHSCAVQIKTKYDVLEKPSEAEKDVHCELGDVYKENCTRMSCQIFCNPKMEGMEIEIPRSAFFFFQDKDEDI